MSCTVYQCYVLVTLTDDISLPSDEHGLSRHDPSSPSNALFGTSHSAQCRWPVADQERRHQIKGSTNFIVLPIDRHAIELFKNHK